MPDDLGYYDDYCSPLPCERCHEGGQCDDHAGLCRDCKDDDAWAIISPEADDDE